MADKESSQAMGRDLRETAEKIERGEFTPRVKIRNDADHLKCGDRTFVRGRPLHTDLYSVRSCLI